MSRIAAPGLTGLYDPGNEHDSCGIALVAKLWGEGTHAVVDKALEALANMEHRGAEGADPNTGDGAGILLQIPDAFMRGAVSGIELPPLGRYGVGVCYLPADPERRAAFEQLIEETVAAEGQRPVWWRDVPVDDRFVGEIARLSAPVIRQLIVEAGENMADQAAFERKLYVIRRLIEREAGLEVSLPSFSSRTIVYKGMLTAPQLPRYFPDLRDPRVASRLALVHSRFSTNTFPSWELAHPFRMIAHNGEVNTLRGNVNWMRARESQLSSELFGDDLAKVLPIVRSGGSDSATFDNVLELLVLSGRSLPHAMMMMIPEAYRTQVDLDPDVRGFYDFHSCLMEPWDGPAAIAFTDGRWAGAVLDRNGLRPGRWVQDTEGYVVLASETGVITVAPEHVQRKGRLAPGRLFLLDLDEGRVVDDAEVKRRVSRRRPYGEWYESSVVNIDDLPEREPLVPRAEPLRSRQLAFGYSQEDLRMVIAPMASQGDEPTASMGNDAALAVLSDRQPPLFSYFKQLFAQVTNPPVDPIRENVVMSLATGVGAEVNLLSESPDQAHQLVIDQPILRNGQLEKLRQVSHEIFDAATLDISWPVEEGPDGMEDRLAAVCSEADEQIEHGANILILSDRNLGAERVAIPSLLAVAAVHHHLVRAGTRLRTGLVIESGEPRDIHHMATLIGYGASAINPYLMFESLDELAERSLLPEDLEIEEAEQRIVNAIGKGLLKTIAKMGISTIQSYCGAQIFEAVGLEREVIDRHFTGTASRIGGVGLDVLATEALGRHFRAYPRTDREVLPVGGVLQWRRDGERHIWNPDTIASLQHAVRAQATKMGDGNGNGQPAAGPPSLTEPPPREPQEIYDDFARQANDEATRRAALRGLMRLRVAEEPVALDEVEPASEIVKRFSTGAMSLGSLSREAHETLAVAMNRLGGKSNTGEGGEDPERYVPDANGDRRRSSIKQVASGRFGVTIDYLVNADQLQIKMAQGAKPGEGGQLPGHKVDDYIAKIRYSTPGVGLISPPPHHDIYSIEDLKQLIYDLRCANPTSSVSVKLVSEVGVGTVASGCAKANADHVTISGHDGGTGASPQSSVQSAGVPWEIGLAETQQTLLLNDLRSRIRVEVDGQIKTGRDVVIGALLGADEFGLSTAPLIAMGCIMMRVCHLNTCPVGIATQDPELRRRFRGTPDHVTAYLMFVAEEVRGLMASLGVRRFEDLIGRIDLLETDEAVEHWKSRGVDLSMVLGSLDLPDDVPRRHTRSQLPVLEDALDWELVAACEPAIDGGEPVRLGASSPIPLRNVNRTVGGILSGEIARRRGARGLPESTIEIAFSGSAGQSFGAWLAPGVTLSLRGETNDYTGKGLSGGVISVRPPETALFHAEENQIVGNTVLYGATAGRAFFRGMAGERFAVRNSGALAVVEGVGDHGCEYMTGGRVVVLGTTGRNFAAGMSGGIAYVYDSDRRFRSRCNLELVDLDELDEDDEEEVKALISEHAQRTRSLPARNLLASWEQRRERFVKVMPRDYRRVLAQRAAEAAPAPA